MMIVLLLLFLIIPFKNIESARILAMFPTPAVSHQIVFETYYRELVRRGHELVVITAYPVTKEASANLTIIDIKDSTIELLKRNLAFTEFGLKSKIFRFAEINISAFVSVIEELLLDKKIQDIICNTELKFDLVILESHFLSGLLFSDIFKAPTILISSHTAIGGYEYLGTPIHHLYYPSMYPHKIYNNDFWDQMNDVFMDFYIWYMLSDTENQNEVIKSIAPNADNMYKIYKKYVTHLFVNINPIWEGIRPVPASVVHLGGLHQQLQRELLSEDLQSYLDSSINGVIYVSFGTNVNLSKLPKEKINILIKVLSEMPYNVLLKWNTEELPGKPKNIRVAKWLPQSEILKHSKIKLFITQAGLQSTDEAITAGVPLLAIPMLFDQWCNAEKYVVHKIGMKVELETLTEEELTDAIQNVINDESYRKNLARLRDLINDQPQSPLERVVWWTEHVLRHGGSHLRAPATDISWTERLELEIIIIVITLLLFSITLILCIIRYMVLYATKFTNLRISLLSNLVKSNP